MKKSWLVYLPVLGFFLSNCTKDPLDNLTRDESRIYVTNYDTTVSFNNYKTFRIADSIAIVTNNQLQGRERTAVDAEFIDAVVNALQQRGYVRVNNGEVPDLGITISAITNTTSHVVGYRDYGNFYGGYWDPFYWDYPGYSYYVPTYYGVYETGETALAIDMVDLKNAANSNNQLNVIWSGLIRGSGIFSGNVSSQVNALFNQSAYLGSQ